MKKLFTIIVFIISTNKMCLSQTVNNPVPVNDENKSKVDSIMEYIRYKPNDFDNFISYFSKKTPKSTDDQDRMFLFLNITSEGIKTLNVAIRHNPLINRANDYLNIEMIKIKTDKQVYPIKAGQFMSGNATCHSMFRASFSKKSSFYNIIQELSETDNATIRMEGGGKYVDFKLSKREKEAIKDVLLLYNALIE